MKKHLVKAIKHPLISGSSIIFVGSFVVNIINYLFNLVMGRLLSVSEYGLLISVVALITLLTLFQSSLTTLFAKFAAKYSANNNHTALSNLLWSGTKITVIIGCIGTVILLIILLPISKFLHIDNPFFMVVMLASVVFSILFSLPSGILQGSLKFIQLSVFNILGVLSKLIIGIVFVWMGFGLVGAGFAILLAFAVPYAVSYIYALKKYKINSKSNNQIDIMQELKKISGPFLVASMAVTILQGTDVIFARHFLNSTLAGQYAALSVMGKAIFYVTSPIFFVFFPLIAQRKELNQSTRKILFFVLGVILVGNVALTVFYTLFPGVILNIFFPQAEYQILKPFLGFYAIYILIFSLAFLMQNYLLSIGKVGIYKITSVCVLIYLVLIFYFHQNISQIILTLIVSSFLLLISLLVYYIKDEKS